MRRVSYGNGALLLLGRIVDPRRPSQLDDLAGGLGVPNWGAVAGAVAGLHFVPCPRLVSHKPGGQDRQWRLIGPQLNARKVAPRASGASIISDLEHT